MKSVAAMTIAIVILVAGNCWANAVIGDYTGNKFVYFNTGYEPPAGPNDFISASFTFQSALVPNHVYDSSSLTAWTITDQHVTFTSGSNYLLSFSVETDSAGQILNWDIVTAISQANQNERQLAMWAKDDYTPIDTSYRDHPYYGFADSFTRGVWTLRETSYVPLPASLLLLAPGLAGLAAIRRRVKK